MCLIQGREHINCSHPTCIRAASNERFCRRTKRHAFMRRNDIRKIKVSRDPDTYEPLFLKFPNPHNALDNSRWRDYELFKVFMGETRAAGEWPNGIPFKKYDIDFQFFLYARRMSTYNPLTDTHDVVVILDVEEAAVYKGRLFRQSDEQHTDQLKF